MYMANIIIFSNRAAEIYCRCITEFLYVKVIKPIIYLFVPSEEINKIYST